ncbi:MAG: glycosyl transferase family 90 [Porphyromonadaceae bacterium]|nr:glycosyl transferase family 90 [Porphyromonadaceae bacterium]
MLRRLRYILSSGKNPKALYYIRSYIRWWLPRSLTLARRGSLLKRLATHPDAEYMAERIEYYNHMPVGGLPSEATPLAGHRPNRQKVYFFDTHEFLRYFPKHLRWLFLPGDIIHVPEAPSIVKSRPLVADNANSVVMKLDKVRHFIFVRDHKRWRDKRDQAIFRGKVSGKDSRIRFMQMYHGHPMCDAADVSRNSPNPAWRREKMSIEAHLDYKFIMALEGNDVASNLKWVMSSQSIAVMPRPTCETWFMEGQLIPNYHYIEISPDLSDLEECLRYYLEHPDEAEAIIRHANEYVRQFRDEERERLIALGVLQRYFERTGQIEKI